MISITKSQSCTKNLNKGNSLCKAHTFKRHASNTQKTEPNEPHQVRHPYSQQILMATTKMSKTWFGIVHITYYTEKTSTSREAKIEKSWEGPRGTRAYAIPAPHPLTWPKPRGRATRSLALGVVHRLVVLVCVHVRSNNGTPQQDGEVSIKLQTAHGTCFALQHAIVINFATWCNLWTAASLDCTVPAAESCRTVGLFNGRGSVLCQQLLQAAVDEMVPSAVPRWTISVHTGPNRSI